MATKEEYKDIVVATYTGRGVFEVKAKRLVVKDEQEKIVKQTEFDFVEPILKDSEKFRRKILQLSEDLALEDYEISNKEIYIALIIAAAKAERHFPTVLGL